MIKPLTLDSIELIIESTPATMSINSADVSTYILSIARSIKLPKQSAINLIVTSLQLRPLLSFSIQSLLISSWDCLRLIDLIQQSALLINTLSTSAPH